MQKCVRECKKVFSRPDAGLDERVRVKLVSQLWAGEK